MNKWKKIDIGGYFDIYYRLNGFDYPKKIEKLNTEELITIFEKLHQDFENEFFDHENKIQHSLYSIFQAEEGTEHIFYILDKSREIIYYITEYLDHNPNSENYIFVKNEEERLEYIRKTLQSSLQLFIITLYWKVTDHSIGEKDEIENYEEFRKYHKQFWKPDDTLEVSKP